MEQLICNECGKSYDSVATACAYCGNPGAVINLHSVLPDIGICLLGFLLLVPGLIQNEMGIAWIVGLGAFCPLTIIVGKWVGTKQAARNTYNPDSAPEPVPCRNCERELSRHAARCPYCNQPGLGHWSRSWERKSKPARILTVLVISALILNALVHLGSMVALHYMDY